jgi:hypothetical protein
MIKVRTGIQPDLPKILRLSGVFLGLGSSSVLTDGYGAVQSSSSLNCSNSSN